MVKKTINKNIWSGYSFEFAVTKIKIKRSQYDEMKVAKTLTHFQQMALTVIALTPHRNGDAMFFLHFCFHPAKS